MRDAIKYADLTAAVDEYLADQLLLPMALGADRKFTTAHISDHLSTNVAVIKQFLPMQIMVKATALTCHEVTVIV